MEEKIIYQKTFLKKGEFNYGNYSKFENQYQRKEI